MSTIFGSYNHIARICKTSLLPYRYRGTTRTGAVCSFSSQHTPYWTRQQFSDQMELPAERVGRWGMQLTPREFDKLMIYMVAEIALKRKSKGIKLNYPEAVAMISAAALDGARAGKTIEEVATEARQVLSKDDVMDGVADLIPMVQVEAVFTDGSRLVTVHTPIQ